MDFANFFMVFPSLCARFAAICGTHKPQKQKQQGKHRCAAARRNSSTKFNKKQQNHKDEKIFRTLRLNAPQKYAKPLESYARFAQKRCRPQKTGTASFVST
jgi:hypothetical protein